MPKVVQSIWTDGDRRANRLRSAVPIEIVTHDYAGLDEGHSRCPFHADKTPSFMVYGGDKGFHCFSCKRNGGPAEFVAHLKGITVAAAVEELEKRYGVGVGGDDSGMVRHLVERSRREGPVATVIESRSFFDEMMAFVKALTGERLREQAERWKVPTDELVMKWRMGWDEESRRYTFPVFSANGDVADVRRRAEDGRPDKVISMKGGGRGGNLFGLSQMLAIGPVVVVGGEKDVIVGSHHLAGLSFVCGTLGESTWRRRWNEHLRDRDVIVWYDNDRAGHAGAREVVRAISNVVRTVSIVNWTDDYPARYDVADVLIHRGLQAAWGLLRDRWIVKRNVQDRVRAAVTRSKKCRS